MNMHHDSEHHITLWLMQITQAHDAHASAVMPMYRGNQAPTQHQGATASSASRQVARTYSGSSSISGPARGPTPAKHRDVASATGSDAKATYASPAKSTTVR